MAHTKVAISKYLEVKMIFYPGQSLLLPELAERLGLSSSEFQVDLVLRGGMGECVRVLQNEKRFALKVIKRTMIEGDEEWKRYLREIRIWTTLSACDGVVEAQCVIRVNEVPVVCSRWMPGGNLRSHLANRSPEYFFSVMARIVGTLSWALEHHDVVHRDLKPDNILLDEGGLAYVSDWGLARPLIVRASQETEARPGVPTASAADPVLTAAGGVLGTISYASPEQLLGAADLDHRTDIYSLGCLMYEWETGRCPFVGTPEQIYMRHLMEPAIKLGGFLKKTTFGAENVIHACLEKKPTNRTPNYAALDLALEKAANGRGVDYQRFRPILRYEMPMAGAGKYRDHMKTSQNVVRNKSGTYAIAERSEIQQFVEEADVLTAIGDYRKAEEIYWSLFVKEAVLAVPDDPLNQAVTIGYALCLGWFGKYKDASEALKCLSGANTPPAVYFVNLSQIQIKLKEYQTAEVTALHGLRIYPDDQDLVGNVLTAQIGGGALIMAAETAKVRLANRRDVHSLSEVAELHCKYAEGIIDLDWPLAFKSLKYASALLREAKDLNPRYLPVRLKLPIALELITAYSECLDEIVAARTLALHVSDRIFLAYLYGRCLDRIRDHQSCWKFCNDWLATITELQSSKPVPRHLVVALERVRAVTLTDGYSIGVMKDGARVTVPKANSFFAGIVLDPELRLPGDFVYLGRLHGWMEKYEEANFVLAEAALLYPKYWEIPFQRASLRMQSGEIAGALELAEFATRLAPWKTQAWKQLAEVHEKLGNMTASLDALKQSQRVQQIREDLAGEIGTS